MKRLLHDLPPAHEAVPQFIPHLSTAWFILFIKL
jgi:hypothetical protein